MKLWFVIGLTAAIAAVIGAAWINHPRENVATTATATPTETLIAALAAPAGTGTAKELSWTNYLAAIAGPPPASSAVIDPGSRQTAALAGDTVIVTRYLPEQVPALNAAYTAAGTDVTVHPTASVPTAGAPTMAGTIIGLSLLVGMVAAGGLYMTAAARRRQRDPGPAGRGHGGSAGGMVGAADIPNVSFDDVAGVDEAVDELREIVDFLTNTEYYQRVGAELPAGALLAGPPGTGKTLLAKAVAGEAGVPFYAVSGAEFVDTYVGVGAKRVRDLFARARAHSSSAIVFIDEIDAIGAARDNGENSNREHNQTLNQLLVEMDGFRSSHVVVLGATNLDAKLDPALTRSGRLEKRITVPLPDRRGRERILATHMARRPVADNVNIDLLAARTAGFSGADLARVVNEAAIVAAVRQDVLVRAADFDTAISTVVMGRARTSAVVNDHDRRLTAYHEAGHAAAALILDDAEDPLEVSIIPRGAAGGVTWYGAGDNMYLTRRQAHARLIVALAGRAGEERALDGEYTSGPHSDFNAATNTALAMVTQYGMTDTGLMIRSGGLLASGADVTDRTVAAVEKLLADALDDARDLLQRNQTLFDAIVDALLEHDTVSAEQLANLRTGAGTRAEPVRTAPAVAPARPSPTPAAAAPREKATGRRTAVLTPAAVAAAWTGWRRRRGERRGTGARA